MPGSIRRLAIVLLSVVYVIPGLFSPPNSHQALATSLELKLSSDVTDDDIRIKEEEVKVIRFNYTLSVTGDANHTLALAICVTVDDTKVAEASVSKDAIVPLHADVRGAFNVSVLGKFVGRANLHLHFVVGHNQHVKCGQPQTEKFQDLLKVSETNQGEEMAMNLTKTSSARAENDNSSSSSSSSSTSTPSVVGLHSGISYQVVVLRQERVIDMVFQVVMVILISIINVGMGSKLDLQVVKATLRRPFAPIIGMCSQFIVMPLISFAITQVFDLSRGIALGFLALGCSPGGSASNIFCYLLGGDVSLSITMTFVSTIASIGLLPLWLFTLGRYVTHLEDINIPFDNIIYSLLGLVAAVVVGLLLKAKKPTWARVAITCSKVALGFLIIFMLTVGLYAKLYIFQLMHGVVLGAAALLPYAGFLLGGLVALVLRMSAKNVITIAIETGIQNTGVAMIILLMSLDHPESDLSVVAPASSALFTPIPLWVATIILKIRRCYRARKVPNDANAPTPGTDASERNVESSSATTTSESLCKKLFGKNESSQAHCWRRLCWYCCMAEFDSESENRREDAETVISAPSSASAGNVVPEKRNTYEFDNVAVEQDEAEDPKPEHPTGALSTDETDKSRTVSGSKSAQDAISVSSDVSVVLDPAQTTDQSTTTRC